MVSKKKVLKKAYESPANDEDYYIPRPEYEAMKINDGEKVQYLRALYIKKDNLQRELDVVKSEIETTTTQIIYKID